MADYVLYEGWARDSSIPSNAILIRKDELAAKQRDPSYCPPVYEFLNPRKVELERREREEERKWHIRTATEQARANNIIVKLIGNDYGLGALRPVVGAETFDRLILSGRPVPTFRAPPPLPPVPQRRQTKPPKPQPTPTTFKSQPKPNPYPAASSEPAPNPQAHEAALRAAQKKAEQEAKAAERNAAFRAAQKKAEQATKAAKEANDAKLAEISRTAQPIATYPPSASQPIPKEIWSIVKPMMNLESTKTTGLPKRFELQSAQFRENFDARGILKVSSPLYQYRGDTSLLSERFWKFILGSTERVKSEGSK
jgi:hypothetical protein